jgi:hypothetical protein
MKRSNQEDYILNNSGGLYLANTLKNPILKILNTHKKAAGVGHRVHYMHR